MPVGGGWTASSTSRGRPTRRACRAAWAWPSVAKGSRRSAPSAPISTGPGEPPDRGGGEADRGGALTVDGTLPYRLTLAPKDTSAAVGSEPPAADTVSLAVRADSFDLALFQPLLPPEAATGLDGRLRADARIGGTIRAAPATGTVNLARATLELPPIGVAYERGELAGRLEGDALRIDRLRLLTGKKQELIASGAIRLRPLSEPALDLEATLAHFRLVNSDQLHTAASGQVQLGGTLLKPVLSGTLVLDRTTFFVGTEAAQAKVEQVELTGDELRSLARDFGPAVLTQRQGNAGPDGPRQARPGDADAAAGLDPADQHAQDRHRADGQRCG